jgi:hypothetical protein
VLPPRYGTLTVTVSEYEFVAELRKCYRGARQALVRAPESSVELRQWLISLARTYDIAIKQAEEGLCPREEIERQLREVECGFRLERVIAACLGLRVPRRVQD